MLLLIQYIITLSNSSSSVNFSVKPPSSRFLYAVFVHVLNFSKIYTASASGEAVTAVPNEQCYTLIYAWLFFLIAIMLKIFYA